MIGVTKLYCRHISADGPSCAPVDPQPSQGKPGSETPASPSTAVPVKPEVIWNVTQACNLNCPHCYSDAQSTKHPDELSTKEALQLIEHLGRFGVKALHLVGGEPLVRSDLFELISCARDQCVPTVLATNGTLITAALATRLKRSGTGYVSISLDNLDAAHNRLRAKPGAFEAAVAGLRHCAQAGQDVGVRVGLRRSNFADLDDIFDFIDRERIARACFHHLVYAGRGNGIGSDDLSHAETRQVMDTILSRAEDFHRRRKNIEILTDDNHVDGVYLYLKTTQLDRLRAKKIYKALAQNGGTYGAGLAKANIDARGDVHPDQYWTHYSLGNIRQKPFGEIWTDTTDPLLRGLRNCLPLLKGRCAKCLWKPLCRGNMRVRAEQLYGDPWMPDPACYLSHDEVSRGTPQPIDTMAEKVLFEEEAA